MIILARETSCDETAISAVEAKGDLNSLSFKVLGSAVNSQIKLHAEYGGVVPNLAKREHQKNLLPVLTETLRKANLISNSQFLISKQFLNTNFQSKNEKEKLEEFFKKIKIPKIDLIAVTVGPGLEPALWTGIKFAEELGKSWGKAVIPTNHMEGHIVSVLVNRNDEFSNKKEVPKVEFPILALLISGGHTELVFLKSWTDEKTIGETQDDAVGEAFDKVARMMDLPYPGGPEISHLASQARELGIMNNELRFPRPMLHSGDLNFSFSGLKTAVLYYLKNITETNICSAQQRGPESGSDVFQISNTKNSQNPQNSFSAPTSDSTDISLLRNSSCSAQSASQGNQKQVHSTNFSKDTKQTVAREFEDAVIETLLTKTKRAIEEYSPKTLIIGGGVIANKALRENFLKLKDIYPKTEILIPEKSLTTDNATMIAAAGFIEYLRDPRANRELKAQGNLDIS